MSQSEVNVVKDFGGKATHLWCENWATGLAI